MLLPAAMSAPSLVERPSLLLRNSTVVRPTVMHVATTGTPTTPSLATSRALSLAPTQTMPARSSMTVQNWAGKKGNHGQSRAASELGKPVRTDGVSRLVVVWACNKSEDKERTKERAKSLLRKLLVWVWRTHGKERLRATQRLL